MKKQKKRLFRKNMTPQEGGEAIWELFCNTITYDNSMGDYNNYIGRYIFESGYFDAKEFVKAIKKYMKEEGE
jgi:hypothetical protein